jgi:hypothetical protein
MEAPARNITVVPVGKGTRETLRAKTMSVIGATDESDSAIFSFNFLFMYSPLAISGVPKDDCSADFTISQAVYDRQDAHRIKFNPKWAGKIEIYRADRKPDSDMNTVYLSRVWYVLPKRFD